MWSYRELLEILQSAAEELGRRPLRSDFDKDRPIGWPHYRSMAYRFGSWTEALRAAGLISLRISARDLSDAMVWTNVELVAFLRQRALELGRTPRRCDCSWATDTHPHGNTIVVRFGSWESALKVARLHGVDKSTFLRIQNGDRDEIALWTAVDLRSHSQIEREAKDELSRTREETRWYLQWNEAYDRVISNGPNPSADRRDHDR